jgi:hypothetical protein
MEVPALHHSINRVHIAPHQERGFHGGEYAHLQVTVLAPEAIEGGAASNNDGLAFLDEKFRSGFRHSFLSDTIFGRGRVRSQFAVVAVLRTFTNRLNCDLIPAQSYGRNSGF